MESIALKLRPADIMLDRVLNPTGDDNLNQWQPDHLLEACGIIPDFFCEALIAAERENPEGITLEHVADGMDAVYQYGGFGYPWGGTVSPSGIYQSQYEEDPPLPPLVRFSFNCYERDRVMECFVYDSAIVAIRERGTSQVFVGRFD